MAERMYLALCKCGIDMTAHDDRAIGHVFDAAGTRHPCFEIVDNRWACPRPGGHEQEGVPHGPLTGEKLW